MAVRRAFLVAPTELIRAVTQVPMFWPMMMGRAAPVVTPPESASACRMPTLAEEAGALGSAILGLAAATGEKDRTALAARFVRYGEAFRPDAERHAYYQKQYQLYKDLREFEVRHVKG